MTRAWHLRQDGKAFPVIVHMYCMGDEDLSSEAEVASFMIKSESKDQDISKYVLDAWMALLIEETAPYDLDEDKIESMMKDKYSHLPYHFSYPVSVDDIISIHKDLNNYSDADSLYQFTDRVRENLESIQREIRRSFNQQFCRVRYGGQYDSTKGDKEIWFRISSVGYNWANTIYKFVSTIINDISMITICRDSESDNSDVEHIYRAKDGTPYLHMPIGEFLTEEHEHSPCFESVNFNRGVLYSARRLLREGKTYSEVMKALSDSGLRYQRDLWRYFLKVEKSGCNIVDRISKHK